MYVPEFAKKLPVTKQIYTVLKKEKERLRNCRKIIA